MCDGDGAVPTLCLVDGEEWKLTAAQMRGFRMAATDMEIARDAVVALLSDEYAAMQRIIETALVVIYSRPFTMSKAHARLEEQLWAPFEESHQPDPRDAARHATRRVRTQRRPARPNASLPRRRNAR